METDPNCVITLRYWAAARAAAGCDSDRLPADSPVSLAEIIAFAEARHPDSGLARVLTYCSVLIGDRPASTVTPAELMVPPGSRVEFLPPFAGG